jgi:DNA replication and repair protein RecF
LRKLGSQGQIKTFTIALKFAVYDFLKRKKGVTPLLLLDDIFDKLDSTRVEHIMQVVAPQERFGQIFITDTNREHLDRIIATLSGNLLLEVEAGHFTPIQI